MHGHIRERKEIPNYVKQLTFQLCYAEHTNVILWLAGNSGEIVIYAFFLGFSSPSRQKDDMSVKYKKLLNLTYHKHEPQSSLA